MLRLVRLLSTNTLLRTFDRLKLARGLHAGRDRRERSPLSSSSDLQRFGAGLAVARRAASVHPIQTSTLPAVRNTVRVYRGSSGTTMVGKIDAICRMIDRCIADESAAMIASRNEASRSA